MDELKVLTGEEVKNLLEKGENVHLVDVREDFEVETGKIPQAVHIPMNTIPENLGRFDKNQTYIIVCRSGARSEKVGYYLLEQGIQAINMEGGMLGWTGEVE